MEIEIGPHLYETLHDTGQVLIGLSIIWAAVFIIRGLKG